MTIARRAVLLPGLALVAASTDAISYLGLGHVFTANMTGNTALLGIGIATGKTGAILRSVCALGGFVLGAVTSQVFVGLRRLLASCLAAELVPLAAWFGWWQAMDEPAHGLPRYGYIALAGLAMGLQSGAVTRLGVPGVTTVFITGTITSLVVDYTGLLRGRPLPQQTNPSHLLQAWSWSSSWWRPGGRFRVPLLGRHRRRRPLGILAVLTAAAFAQPPSRRADQNAARTVPDAMPRATTAPNSAVSVRTEKDRPTMTSDGRLSAGSVISSAPTGPVPSPAASNPRMIGISPAVGITNSAPATANSTTPSTPHAASWSWPGTASRAGRRSAAPPRSTPGRVIDRRPSALPKRRVIALGVIGSSAASFVQDGSTVPRSRRATSAVTRNTSSTPRSAGRRPTAGQHHGQEDEHGRVEGRVPDPVGERGSGRHARRRIMTASGDVQQVHIIDGSASGPPAVEPPSRRGPAPVCGRASGAAAAPRRRRR